MKNRIKTIEVTKNYIDAFNRRDMQSIEQMLDPDELAFARQGQPTIIGRDAVMRRVMKTFERLDRQGHQLHLISAIIDFKGMMAHPCMLGIMDGERFSVVVLDCKTT